MVTDDIDMAAEIADSLDDLKDAHTASNITIVWRGKTITALHPTDPTRQVVTMEGGAAGVTGNLFIDASDKPPDGADGDVIIVISDARQLTRRIAGIIGIGGAILEIGQEDEHSR